MPAGYAQLQPLWLNWFENIAAVQFDHRVLAVATVAAIVAAVGGGAAGEPAETGPHCTACAAGSRRCCSWRSASRPCCWSCRSRSPPRTRPAAVLLLTAAIVLRHTLRGAAVMDAASAGDHIVFIRWRGRRRWQRTAHFRQRPSTTGRSWRAPNCGANRSTSLDWATPEGIRVKPLYTAADLEGDRSTRACSCAT